MTFLRKNLILIAFLSLIVPADVFAEKINLKKEINLFELSEKYPRCKNDLYRDDCYDIDRGRGFLYEGYWKKNRLWEGIYRDEFINKITHKYIDGIKVGIYYGCEKNILSGGWYLCESGEKYKPIRNGRFDQLDNKQGQFIYKFSSGNIFEGNYKDNLWHGYGKYTWADGTVYEGNFKDSVYHGYGKMTWANGDIYEGNWKDNVNHGYGKMTWANGDIYEGNWKDDVKYGYGKITWANGDIYEGNWKDDVNHGYGKYTWASGNTYEGNWYKGEMVDK